MSMFRLVLVAALVLGCNVEPKDTTPVDADDTVGTIHLMIWTDDSSYAGTNDGSIEFCLSASDCFKPYKPSWNDLERGSRDIQVFEAVGLSRSALDRFVVQTTDGEDRWTPAGFQVSFDGETVYCKNDLDFYIGNGAGELLSWTDPDGLHVDCTTVFETPLTHGPFVGDVGPNSAQVWYRTDSTRQVKLFLATSEAALATAAPVNSSYPQASTDFTHSVNITGLVPETSYVYELEIEGTRYGPWPLQTTPTKGSSTTLKFAFGSCTKHDDQPIFGPILSYNPDLFLFLGDNHYANSNDLNALRQYYRWAHERSERSTMMSSVPILATWDDHDFVGNNTDGREPGKAVALRVFKEYWANPSYGTVDTEGVFFESSYGDVDFFVIDDRYWRDIDDSVLGDEQEAWLLSQLAASTAVFKFIASGSQFTTHGSGDSWAAYLTAQGRLLQHIVDNSITGVVFLSGDVHRSEFRSVAAATGGYAIPELTSSPMANTNARCPTDSELRECFNTDDYFIGVEVNTTTADPTVKAQLFDRNGELQAVWDIKHSDLTF